MYVSERIQFYTHFLRNRFSRAAFVFRMGTKVSALEVLQRSCLCKLPLLKTIVMSEVVGGLIGVDL